MLVLKTDSLRIAKGVVLTEEANEVIENFKRIAYEEEHNRGDVTMCLCLKPLDEEQKLEYMLEEGMYEYHSNNPWFPQFKEILEELVDCARAMTFTKEDILASI